MNIPELYTEEIAVSEPYRALYVESVKKAIDTLATLSNEERNSFITPEKLRDDPSFYRQSYADLIGLTRLNEVFGDGIPRIYETPHAEDSLAWISRLKIELAEGIFFTGILFIPKNATAPYSLTVASHGGGGSPELCADMIGPNNYSHLVRKLLSAGEAVFAPQLMLWNLSPRLCGTNIPQYSTSYDRGHSERAFKQCGTSIVAFEIYAITRTATALLARENIRSDGYRMTGLSYGGFYTLYTMAYDTRIHSGYSVAYFNDKFRYNWHDMIWMNSGARFTDVEIAALCAPRALRIEIGRTDPVFEATTAEPLFPAVRAYFRAQNAEDQLSINLWDGGHRYDAESDGMEFFLSH